MIFLTRQLAYAIARDTAVRRTAEAAGHRGAGHPILPWTELTSQVFADTFRETWSLDDEFAEQEFKSIYGRAPNAVSDHDYNELTRIHAERRAAGIPLYGLAPREAEA